MRTPALTPAEWEQEWLDLSDGMCAELHDDGNVVLMEAHSRGPEDDYAKTKVGRRPLAALCLDGHFTHEMIRALRDLGHGASVVDEKLAGEAIDRLEALIRPEAP